MSLGLRRRSQFPFRQEQEVVGQLREVPSLIQQVVESGPVLRDAAILGRGYLQGGLNRSQWTPQFVRGIGNKLLLPLDVCGHLVEQAIDRERQLVEFIPSAAHLQAVSEPGGLEVLSRPQDIGDRTGCP